VWLERLAITAAGAVERSGPARTTMADPALVELAVSAGGDEAARARALRLLGFTADRPVRVVAVRSSLPLDRIGALVCPAHPAKAASLPDVGVILAPDVVADRFPPGVRAGIGAAPGPDRSWRQARTDLRLTTPRRPVVHHDDLGAPALPAEIPPDAARQRRRGGGHSPPGYPAGPPGQRTQSAWGWVPLPVRHSHSFQRPAA
jgi:hypothetical protein